MLTVADQLKKRAVNLTLSEGLVAQAKLYTRNLSATMEGLLTEFVHEQQKAAFSHKQAAERCADRWNELHASIGSFADEHSTL